MSLGLPPDSQPRYFAYDASSNANLVIFQLANLSANADLYAQFGLPFPTPTGTPTFASTNPGTNDDQITVAADLFPAPLSSNRWYLGVFNADTTGVTGTILANEFAVYGTNVTLLSCQVASNALWLTWASLPGSYYYIAGAPGLAGGALSAISATLVATDYQTTFPVPLPSTSQTLVVLDGPVPGGDLTRPLVGPPLLTPTGVQLQWTARTNSQFQVQWSPSLAPPAWTTFPGIVVSPTGAFSFLDDGSLTSGLDTTRFYRLVVVP